MNVLVLYQSRSGHTRDVAEAIAQAALNLNYKVNIKSVTEARAADIESADTVFIGTWVHGLILFGVRPAGAELWVPTLPSLKGKKVGVFCTYAFTPRGSLRALSAMLAERGATIVGQRAFQRNHLTDGVQMFVQSVLQSPERVVA